MSTSPHPTSKSPKPSSGATSEKESEEKCPSPLIQFQLPHRPNHGTEGREISLRSNHFAMTIQSAIIQHYNVEVKPEKCPRRVNREIIRQMVSSYPAYFDNKRPVYDGKCNLYSMYQFAFGEEQMSFEVILPGESTIDPPYTVSLKLIGEISIAGLDNSTKTNERIPYEKVQMIDTIIRHLPSSFYVSTGRSFFSAPDDPNNEMIKLGGGREIWYGYHQSVRGSDGKLLLNIDTSATTFYCAVPVIEFLAEILELPVQAFIERRALSDSQRVKFAREIRGLRIEISHCGTMRRRYRVYDVTRKTARTETFPWTLETGHTFDCFVEKYFLDQHGIRLKYPHLPCLQVGKPENKTFLPLEVCTIVRGQRCMKKLTDNQTSTMIKATSRTAPQRELEICELVRNMEYSKDLFINEFGIKINPSMSRVTGRVLSAPKIQYAGRFTTPSSGVWDMRGRQFHTGIKVSTWAIVSFTDQNQVKETDLRTYTRMLQRISKDVGMPIESDPCFCKYAIGIEQVEPILRFLKQNYKKLQFVMIVLPGKTSVYAEIKRIGDTLLGLPTQCIQARNVIRINAQTATNLCMKLNMKLGGINSIIVPSIRPSIFNESVVFLGCDINHPTNNDNKHPTVAAVCGSIDAHPSRYAASVRLQHGRGELIKDMHLMVKESLIQFYKNTHFKPARIVVYRTGVSEGQFFNVLQYELRAIRQACLMLETGYQPGVTFIAVQKRHHTRLFAVDKVEQTGKAFNIPAGTTVDNGITHPIDFDFFLCSHAGIQGTSRPSHYNVLWDDNAMSADDLQQMTYQLCHTYARCTRSVSIPAPAFYAHLVASRARYHLVDRDHDSAMGSQTSKKSLESNLSIKEQAIKVHPDSHKVMYFA